MPNDETDRPMDRAALALDTARVELNDAIDDAKDRPTLHERLVAARRTIDKAVAELSWIGIDLAAARSPRPCHTRPAPSSAASDWPSPPPVRSASPSPTPGAAARSPAAV